MILQPVLGGQVVYQIYINAAKNEQYVAQKRSSANDKATDVLDYFKQDAKLTQRYHELLDGKWNHILDREFRFSHCRNCTDQSRNPSWISGILATANAQHGSSSSLRPGA
jgi:chemotaxis regulatin CheY-phosphate phosphatase CheZ